jgi:hypothetical protein
MILFEQSTYFTNGVSLGEIPLLGVTLYFGSSIMTVKPVTS